MFKQLYLRMTGMALLVVILGVLVTGILCFFGAVNLYTTQFSEDMDSIGRSALPQQIGSILASDTDNDKKSAQAEEVILSYTGKLGIDENRSWFVLSARDASIILPLNLSPSVPTRTPNLSAAMKTGNGDEIKLTEDYLDYALYIRNGITAEDGYIFYIRDNKTDLQILVRRTLVYILWALLFGFVASLLLGLFMAYQSVAPLRQVAKRAENFAQGNYEPSLDKVPSGEVGELIKSLNRIGTAMNNTLKQINTDKHKVEVILEHINNGIIAFDINQNIIHINPAAKKIFNITDESSITFDAFFKALDTEICMAEFMYLQDTAVEERELVTGDNHIKASLVPFKMDNDKTAGVICVFEDVTKQFNLENARQKFVAEVSHELKTPLTTIRTYTETLLNGYLDDKKTATGFLNTVQNETDKMTAMVQNLLILNRFDMQQVDIRREKFSLDLLLRRLEDTFALEAEKKGLELTYNRTTDLPDIEADQYQIERAIKNIISNSIKYCTKGDKIQIFSGKLYNNVYIKVEDTGKGIPKADLKHVFERFYRVDKDRSRDKGGTGLGLSITKEIIEGHGGTIEIESDFGKFTRVTINLPI